MRRLALTVLVALGAACAGEAPTPRQDRDAAGHDRGHADAVASGDRSASPTVDGAGPAEDSAAPVPCGEFVEATRFVCAKDGMSRGRCDAGQGTIESCPRGCLRNKAPDDDVCLGSTPSWTPCTGVQGTVKAADGDYYVTWFGCWVDASGTHHKDPGDNCIPGCFAYATNEGICPSSATGPQCEEQVAWFTANNGRFPCLSRLRISNPANGRAVIAIVLDGGPSCTAENQIGRPMLDISAPAFNYLYEDGSAWSTDAVAHVIEVDESFPLGIAQ